MTGSKIVKKESKTGAYTDIFEVKLPVAFFFVGTEFDGIELDMEEANAEDLLLAKELCLKLAPALSGQAENNEPEIKVTDHRRKKS